jgi:hypothetical protein
MTMPEILQFSCGAYRLETALHEPPHGYSSSWRRATLWDDFDLSAEGTLLVVGVAPADASAPTLVVSQRFEPGPGSGFQPGILVVPETSVLFIGAGTRILAYDLLRPQRLWHDEAEMGFWFWRRHRDVIVMSAELELAAWDIHGQKLWTTFVEPPWGYTVREATLSLDVMGTVTSFPLASGPERVRRT